MEWYYFLVILIGSLLILLFLLYWFIKSNLTVIPTGKITENIVCIKNGIANAFIYTKGSDYLIIDTGVSAKKLKRELIKMNIIPEKVTHVFITHADPDHTGGISIFDKIQIFLGKGSRIKNLHNYMLLDDNQIIMVGSTKVQAISSPGHRMGHTCYLIDDKCLFTGDLLRLKVGEIKPFFKMISNNYEKMIQSIKKISSLENVKILLTAHSGYSTQFDSIMEKWKNQ